MSASQQIADIIDAAAPPVLSTTSETAAFAPAGDGPDPRDLQQGVNHSPESTAKNEPCTDDGAGKKTDSNGFGSASARSSRSPAGDSEGPPGLRSRGFDVARLNQEFALVLMGSKAVVFLEQPTAMIEDQQRVLTIEAFNAWFANRFTEVATAAGEIRTVTWAKAWLQSPKRRQYRGIEFHPDPNNAPGSEGYLNLWSGFAVKPAPVSHPNAYKIFRDHLLTNVCGGDEALFNWVFGFFAQIVQRPRERIGVALVMRGRMGSGKTKVGEVFGSLFPRHYFLVDDPRYVTGQFNAHMASCLLLQADEAVWAGDKAAEGRLKGLITSPIQQIEAKGVDPIRLPNYVRLVMTSNEDWVVPAGMDERRFCVVDVDPRCAQHHEYFKEMDEELAKGGRECLLADLLAFDLDSINLRQIPRTEALLEQKIRSLDSVASWWYERLAAGTTLAKDVVWNNVVHCEALFNDYIHIADKIGVRRKQEETAFGMRLKKLVPSIKRCKRTHEVMGTYGEKDTTRVWCYVFPNLAGAREAFEAQLNQPVSWPLDDECGGDDE